MKKTLETFEQALALTAIVSIAVIMILVSADACARYLLNRPLAWASEFTSFYLMSVAIYFMVATTLRKGDHININVFRAIIPKRLLAWSDILWSFLTAVVFIFIAYGSLKNIFDSYAGRDFIPGYFKWPVWLSHLPILVGTASIVLSLVLNIFLIAMGAENPYAEDAGDVQE